MSKTDKAELFEKTFLMLDSDQPGIREAAVHKAYSLLKESGRSFREILSSVKAGISSAEHEKVRAQLEQFSTANTALARQNEHLRRDNERLSKRLSRMELRRKFSNALLWLTPIPYLARAVARKDRKALVGGLFLLAAESSGAFVVFYRNQEALDANRIAAEASSIVSEKSKTVPWNADHNATEYVTSFGQPSRYFPDNYWVATDDKLSSAKDSIGVVKSLTCRRLFLQPAIESVDRLYAPPSDEKWIWVKTECVSGLGATDNLMPSRPFVFNIPAETIQLMAK